ncbi:MAG: helix-turn-helix transcriptional regulator [Oscillospiraceae bacterium]|nr:helix-turn-helix transcriptional regulator [Oscillospiraceae bacterium]
MKLSLSQNICKLRKSRSMTQEQLAEALGVTFASVSKWERDVATPDLHFIAEMADLFRVSVDSLIGYTLQNNSVAALKERIYKLQQEKNYEEAVAVAEKALLRYPNIFSIVYRSGRLYAAAGVELCNEKCLYRCIDLLEHSILLLSQNTVPEISEASIRYEIAQCYIILGNPKKAVEILKKYNVSGVYNALIAIALTGNDITYTNTSEFELEEAVPFMVDAFGDMIKNTMQTMMAYANYFCKKKDYAAGREALLWLASLLESVKIEKNSPCYVDKVIAPCYSECANLSLLLGEEEKVETYLQKAYTSSMIFDSAPTCKVENIKFCIGDIQGITVYDDLGETASAGVLKQLMQENRDPKLLHIWNKIAEKAGGSK